jgi:two-component system OmpR family response regulator
MLTSLITQSRTSSSSSETTLGTSPRARVARPLKVFLVEDSKLIRERLEEALGASGEISISGYADSEATALPALQGSEFDAIILDLQLRHGNGLAVLRRVRAEKPGPRPLIIVFTNFATPHFREVSMRCGADYFFDKSRDYDRVREVLEDLAHSDDRRSH